MGIRGTKEVGSMDCGDWDAALEGIRSVDEREDVKEEVRRLLEKEAGLSNIELERRFRLLANRTAVWGMETNNQSMIDRFINGSGGIFSSKTLTDKAFAHSTTKQFVTGIKALLGKKLRANQVKGEFTTMVDFPYEALKENKGITKPEFESLAFWKLELDPLTGLMFAVHTPQSYSAEASNIVCDWEKRSYRADLTVTLKDDFGLDPKDIVKFGTGTKVWKKLKPDKGIPGAMGIATSFGIAAVLLGKQAQKSKDGTDKSLYKGFAIASGVISGVALLAGIGGYTVATLPTEEVAAGFRAWFILQHYHGCHPFTTEMKKTYIGIAGRIPKG